MNIYRIMLELLNALKWDGLHLIDLQQAHLGGYIYLQILYNQSDVHL